MRWTSATLSGVILAAAWVGGQALANAGEPLAGVDIAVQQSAGGLAIHKLTDAHGVATFEVKAGRFAVRADVMKLLVSSRHRYEPYLVIMLGNTKAFAGSAVSADGLPGTVPVDVTSVSSATMSVTLTDSAAH